MIGSFFVVIRLFFGEDIIGIQLLTVFVGGDARFFVKLFDEQRGVGESAQIADLGDGLLGGGDQLFCVFQIDPGRLALALDVGTVTFILVGAFVVFYSRGLERAVNDVDSSFDVAFSVRILYAQHEIAAVLFSKEVSVKAGTQVAYMHKARRRGRESCSDFFFHIKLR